MNKIEVICPSCGERMDVPEGCEKITCMFCAVPISLTDYVAQGDEDVSAFLTDLPTFIDPLFAKLDYYLQQFNRNHYRDAFALFSEENALLRSSFERAVDRSTKECYEGLSNCILQTAEKLLAQQKKTSLATFRLNLNLFVVSFVFPFFGASSKESVRNFSGFLCDNWNEKYTEYTIHVTTMEEIDGGFKRKLCYITTAICESVYEDTSREEIEILCDFRDHYLMEKDDGKRLVSDYYDIAPTIVKRIEKESDSELIYRHLYQTYLLPCVNAIRDGSYDRCLSIYIDMVMELKGKYLLQASGAD